jgi:GntR family transcriptional regulator
VEEVAVGSFLDVDPTRADPIWRQIEDGVRRLAASGRLPEGTSVPSVRELARELRINPATVAKAYRRLVDDGVLEVRRGEGTFVADRPPDRRRADRQALLQDGAGRFTALAHELGASLDESIKAIRRQWPEAVEDTDGS